MKNLSISTYSLILALLLPVFLPGDGKASRAAEVVSSTADGCRFVARFSSDFREVIPIEHYNSDGNDSGVVLTRTFFVAVPPGAEAELVSVTPGQRRAFEPASLVGTREIIRTELVKLGPSVIVRGRELVPIIVSPISGEAGYGKIEIALAFRGGATASTSSAQPDPFFDRVIMPEVINGGLAGRWSRPRSASAGAEVEPAGFNRSDTWIKIHTTQMGLHYVTGTRLLSSGITAGELLTDGLRLFNGGGQPLSIFNDDPRPEFKEVACYVDDGGDGRLDLQDRLYFFAEAVDRYIYRPARDPLFVNNIYTGENVFWLAYGGRFTAPPVRMASVDESFSVPDTTISAIEVRTRVEQDNILLRESDGHIESYFVWYWDDGTQRTDFVATPGAIEGDTAIIRIAARTSGVSNTLGYVDLWVNDLRPIDVARNAFSCIYKATNLNDGLNEFRMTLTPISSSAGTYTPPYLDNIEVFYNRELVSLTNTLDIPLGESAANVRLQIMDAFSGPVVMLDLADPVQPSIISSISRTSGTMLADVVTEAPGLNRFYISTWSEAVEAPTVVSASPRDLTSPGGQADLIIVTAGRFVNALDEYVTYREGQGVSIEVVTVDDIIDNFSFGMTDPVAIRDFLKYAYETWPQPAPSAVLLAGDANYDFLDAFGTGQPNHVPSLIHGLINAVDPTYSDDNYVYFGEYGIYDADTSYPTPDRGFDMVIARWPVTSTSEINVIVDKIRRYESSNSLGTWRNRVTYVADDEHGTFPTIAEPFHTWDSEILDTIYTPRNYQRRKVYMVDFPFANSEKPAANHAIVDAFNDGSLIVNYVGHGNPDVWAHEHVFTRQTDLPQLTNRDELSLVIAASCAIGFFDDPLREGMGEDLLAMASGGAIATIAATRLVYALENALFNRMLYDVLFSSPDLSVCEAMYMAKLRRQYGGLTIPYRKISNDRAFAFIGDPLLKLGGPAYTIRIDEAPDSLGALSRATVSGQVTDASDVPLLADGTLFVTVVDSDRLRTHTLEIGIGSDIHFKTQGPVLFKGSAPISSGAFSFSFITPLDIGFGGNSARISMYAILDTTDAVGLVDSLPVSSLVTVTTDSVGPEITIGIAGRDGFVNGDAVVPGDNLEIAITDSSGVNLSTELGHGITLEIDDRVEQMVSITEQFTYDPDDFTTGSVHYALGELSPGRHSIKVKAWDNANNSATSTTTLEVVSSASLAILDLLNYPNPMADATTFYFDLTQSVAAFNLEIFTLAGRKIQSITRRNLPLGSHRIGWDGRDADGDRLATGVYIYRASATPERGGEPVESFGKIVIVN